MATLGDYQHALEEQRTLLHRELGKPAAAAFAISVLRGAFELMKEELQLRPTETVNIWELRARGQPGLKGPFLWQTDAVARSAKALRQYEPSEGEILQKDLEYRQAFSQLNTLDVRTHTGGNCGVKYFIDVQTVVQLDANTGTMRTVPRMDTVKDEFRRAVQTYMAEHRHDPAFYRNSAIVGLATVLEERQDIVLSLRAVQDLGAVVTESGPDIAMWQEAIAFGVMLVPYVGNTVALLEATQGRDMFCRKLSIPERGLAVLSVLIPFLGRGAKVGRSLYTAARMSRLYGRDATKWSYMVAMGERASVAAAARQAVQKAGKQVIEGKQALSPQLLADARTAVSTLLGKTAIPAAEVAAAAAVRGGRREALFAALRDLARVKPTLAELDEYALQRVVDASVTKDGPSLALAKGQLLEEFKQSRTMRLLQDQYGTRALGVDRARARIEYYPGHVIADSNGRKLTDGLITTRLTAAQIQPAWYGARTPAQIARIEGVLDLIAIDEAKAGAASSKGLAYKYDVTEADRSALKEVAAKRFAGNAARAAKGGAPVTETLEQIEKQVAKEYKLGEMGGQARATLERLDQLEDGSLTSIFVGNEEYLVRVPGVSKVKIFGVLPSDVQSAGIVKRLTDSVKDGGEGLNFEVIGVGVTQKELEELANEVLKVAKTVK